MDAQRRTALIFVTQDVGYASCMCDWGISERPWTGLKCNYVISACEQCVLIICVTDKLSRAVLVMFVKKDNGTQVF